MSKEELGFEHESLQSRRSIVAYLQALQEGFQSGTLVLSDPEGRIELKPNGLLRFEVQAAQKGDRIRLVLRFSWKHNGRPGARPWPFTVKSGGT
jgi:amphi-Trp domain-containing protein